jgi:hypothetical protein
LFYLGLLGIQGPEKDKLRLQIPNETVKRLYYKYIEEAYRETGIFDLDLDKTTVSTKNLKRPWKKPI